jgi:myosin heavy subunit
MKETLDKLDIELDEDLPDFCIPTPTKISDIPMAEDDGLLEDTDVEEAEVEEAPVEDTEVEEPADETEGEAEEEVEETTDEVETEETVETIAAEEEPMTVGQFLDGFKDMDTEMPITINSVELDGKTYETDLEFEVKDGELFVNVSCVASEEETEETSEEDNTEEETEDATEETEAEETVDETEEAVDDGDDEVVESMKALVRQNSALAEEVKTLKKQNAETKTAGDARVNELQEELDKYKAAFAKVSAVASRGKKSVAELQEQLTNKDTKINLLTEANTRLSEAVECATTEKDDKVEELKEKLAEMQKENDETVSALKEELNKTKKLVTDRTNIAKSYKAKLQESVQKYISFRASMLGVKSTDITNRLNESYTFADIDAVCEDLLTSNANISRLPISSGRVTTRINESAKPKKTAPVNEWSYEVDDTLLELAGLKK